MKKNPKTSRQVRGKTPAATNPRAELPANQVVITQAEIAMLDEMRKMRGQTTRECESFRKAIGHRLADGAEFEAGKLKPALQRTMRRPLTQASLTVALGEDGYKQVRDKIPLEMTTRLLIGPSEADE